MRGACYSLLSLGLAIALLTVLGSALALAPAVPAEPPIQWEKLDQRLAAKIAELNPEREVAFILRLTPEAYLEDVKFRREEVIPRLEMAAASQRLVMPVLEQAGFEVRQQFWITNALLVEGPATQIGDLTRLASVQRIHENFEVSLIGGGVTASTATPLATPTWGVAKVGADLVWSGLGVQGEGVRVCVSDTGVDISHPDLTNRMWSDAPGDPEFPGGWIEIDAFGGPVLSSSPHDTHGHGTHTSGTVLGGNTSGTAIGMAPNATLMHALVLPGGAATFAQVLAGIEWCVSPYDDQGNPAGTPADVHSMSWGAIGYWSAMVDPLRNSYLAGTLPVAATGNCGEGCSATPGNSYDVIGVGASDVADQIALFSGGEVVQKTWWVSPPADWPSAWTTPVVSAPGVSVYSSLPGGGYAFWDGTSMATPHVAGCAALMLSANPMLTPDAIRQSLTTTAEWFDTYYPAPPDPRYGWGRIDCFAAVVTGAFNSGMRGTVTDQADAEPLDWAQIDVTAPGMARRVQTDAVGAFNVTLPPGTYNVTVDRFGYLPATLNNVTVPTNVWVELTVQLTPLPRGNITGAAFHNTTGFEIPGVDVRVMAPIEMVARTNDTGVYVVRKVPEGTYELRTRSPYFKEAVALGVVVVRDTNVTADFLLDPLELVAVMGDQLDSLSTLLQANGYEVANPDWSEVRSVPDRYRVVVVNAPPPPGAALFKDFISATDAAGTGVVFLDTYALTGAGGIYYLWDYLGDPASRGSDFDSAASSIYYNVTRSHPILAPFGPGDPIILENTTTWHDHAWFDFYAGENGTVLAQAGVDSVGDRGQGIAVDNRANNRHVLLSMHGASSFVRPSDWTPEGTDVFLNAVAWAWTSRPDFRPVDFDLQVNPAEGLWSETFQVSIKAKNVGSAGGNYTARLYVDGVLEANQTVSLPSGEARVVSLNVTRDPVGVYGVAIGPHTGTFRVRPPRMVVQAAHLNGTALANGSVSVGMGDAVLDMGTTDANGTLVFDSPGGSHGQLWVILHAAALEAVPQYFLAQNLAVESDLTVDFPTAANSTALLDLQMEEVVAGQRGMAYLRRTDMPPAFANDFLFDAGPIVVDPAPYRIWARMGHSSRSSTWEMNLANATVNLTSVPSRTFLFGGPLTLDLSWSQTGTQAAINWTVADGHQNPLVGLVQKRVGLLATPGAFPHIPSVSLWDSQGTLLASGFVDWGQRPLNVTLPLGADVAFVHVDLETGGYPYPNLFALEVEIRDPQGGVLPGIAVTNGTWVEMRGSVLRSGTPIPINLTLNGLPVFVHPNGTFSETVNLTEGLNTLVVAARDLAGHTRNDTFLIQSKPNVFLAVNPLPSLTNVTTLTVEGAVESGASLWVNGVGRTANPNGRFLVTLELQEGPNTIVVMAEDFLGTREEVSQTVLLDTTPPEIRIVEPPSGYVTREAHVTIRGETENLASLTVNGVPIVVASGAWAHQASLAEGENHFQFRAVDPAGNSAEMTLLIHQEPLLMGLPTQDAYLLFALLAAAAGSAVLLFVWMRRRRAVETGGRAAEEPAATEQEIPLEVKK